MSRKRVQRLMRIMGMRAIYRSPRTSRPAPEHRVYPYLLEQIRVTRPNQAWAADITYLPMARGFLYLVAIMDWHSRYVVAWRLSNTLEADFCVGRLEGGAGARPAGGLQHRPGQSIDQSGIHPGTAGTRGEDQHGREGAVQRQHLRGAVGAHVKYEEVYLKAYANATEARRELSAYLRFYNDQRPHQALGYWTPSEVFHQVTDVGEERAVQAKKSPIDQTLVSLAGAAGLSLNST